MNIGILILTVVIAIMLVFNKFVFPMSSIMEEIGELYKQQGFKYVDYYNGVKYVGGVDNISVNSEVAFTILEEGLLVENNNVFLKLIRWNDIKNISFKTKQSIQEQISLGKLLVFGILAFGMDKNKKI